MSSEKLVHSPYNPYHVTNTCNLKGFHNSQVQTVRSTMKVDGKRILLSYQTEPAIFPARRCDRSRPNSSSELVILVAISLPVIPESHSKKPTRSMSVVLSTYRKTMLSCSLFETSVSKPLGCLDLVDDVVSYLLC